MNDGGPAFPAQEFNADLSIGMSLRDYFAAKAMQGLLSNETAVSNLYNVLGDDFPKGLATKCYQMADAMIAERGK